MPPKWLPFKPTALGRKASRDDTDKPGPSAKEIPTNESIKEASTNEAKERDISPPQEALKQHTPSDITESSDAPSQSTQQTTHSPPPDDNFADLFSRRRAVGVPLFNSAPQDTAPEGGKKGRARKKEEKGKAKDDKTDKTDDVEVVVVMDDDEPVSDSRKRSRTESQETTPHPPKSRKTRPKPPSALSSPPLAPTPIDPELEQYVKLALNSTVARDDHEQRAMDCMTYVCITSRVPFSQDDDGDDDVPPPFVARIRLRGKIKVLREAWFGTYARKIDELRDKSPDDVILTWRLQRVWELNTLWSLGIRPRSYDQTDKDDFDDDEEEDGEYPPLKYVGARDVGQTADPGFGFMAQATQIHIEAWTTERWAAHEAAQRVREADDILETSDDDTSNDADTTPKMAVSLISKTHPPFKARVVPTMTADELVAMFCAEYGMEKDGVALVFDGERMLGEETLEGAGIDDDDGIQVFFK